MLERLLTNVQQMHLQKEVAWEDVVSNETELFMPEGAMGTTEREAKVGLLKQGLNLVILLILHIQFKLCMQSRIDAWISRMLTCAPLFF